MSDKNLNTALKIAVVFLAAVFVFFVFATVQTTRKSESNPPPESTSEPTMPPETEEPALEVMEIAEEKKIIVLDAGHGKSSGTMTTAEKEAEGYMYSEVTDSWGEWRHYKNGTFGEDCYGSQCTLTVPQGGSCWYPMENADRDTEPEVNLANALAAKRYLEEMGYEVRMTRNTNDENPSMNRRVSYCFPNNDIMQNPDASLYICLHSNAGGGSGTSYIHLEGNYLQTNIPPDYREASNAAGEIINARVAAATGLKKNPPITGEGYLILFNKCPVPIAYLEIGFYDNANDLAILNSSSDAIGKAVAEGVEQYLSGVGE